MKTCNQCGTEKPIEQFYKNCRTRDGRLGQCNACVKGNVKRYQQADPVGMMLRRAKSRAATKGWVFCLDRKSLLPLPERCPILGIKLRSGVGPQDPHAYSLDRVDNADGYFVGNVVVMSYLANRLKNNGTAEHHEAIAAWMRKQEAKNVFA
jgi:hypothetical protein